ncbi:MAG: hypothetical protein JWP10_1130 [Nocardioidaceae bacterium]|nr:hypothetical protein [Nocardioidaceae bacterium]
MSEGDVPRGHRREDAKKSPVEVILRVLDRYADTLLGEIAMELALWGSVFGGALVIVLGTRAAFDTYPQATLTVLLGCSLLLVFGIVVLARSALARSWSLGRTLTAGFLVVVPALGWLALVAPKLVDFALDI